MGQQPEKNVVIFGSQLIMSTLLLGRLERPHVGKKIVSGAVVINCFPPTVFLVLPHMTTPQPGPSKVTLSRTEQVNAEQLEVLQPFRLL